MLTTSDIAAYWSRPAWPAAGPPETAQVFGRWPAVAARGAAVDQFASDIVRGGLWDKFDLLYLSAAPSAQAARINLAPPWTGTVTNLILNSAFENTGGAAPTSFIPAVGTGSSTPAASTVYPGEVAYAQSAAAQRPLIASPVINFAANTTYTISLTIEDIAGGLVAQDLLRLSETPVGASFTWPNCSANPTGGAFGAVTVGRLVVTVSLAAAALATRVYLGIGCAGAATGSCRFSRPQVVAMDVPGDPIRTTGTAASQIQTHNRFDLTAINSPSFVSDRGYAGATNAYLATRYNPAQDGQRYTRNSAHVAAWSLTNRGVSNMVAGGVSMNTSLQCGLMARSASGPAWINVNDQGAPLGEVARSDGLTLGSRLDAATRSNYRDGALLGTAAAPSINVPSAPLDLLCWTANGYTSRLYWCTDRIAAWSMGAGLTATEVAAFHGALRTYLQAIGAVSA